jgi:N-acetyl-gamma-glutamylphosphate reductase
MVVPFSRGIYLKNYLSNSNLIEFENADHALPFVYEEETIQKIISFLGFK